MNTTQCEGGTSGCTNQATEILRVTHNLQTGAHIDWPTCEDCAQIAIAQAQDPELKVRAEVVGKR